jgi:N-acetyl-gamma-glutamylphosphate reductase
MNIFLGICFILFGSMFLYDLYKHRHAAEIDHKNFIKFGIGVGFVFIGILTCFNLT